MDRLIDRLYRYDTDSNGKLSADELPPRAQRLIEQADIDQDGSVDRRELESFFRIGSGSKKKFRDGLEVV